MLALTVPSAGTFVGNGERSCRIRDQRLSISLFKIHVWMPKLDKNNFTKQANKADNQEDCFVYQPEESNVVHFVELLKHDTSLHRRGPTWLISWLIPHLFSIVRLPVPHPGNWLSRSKFQQCVPRTMSRISVSSAENHLSTSDAGTRPSGNTAPTRSGLASPAGVWENITKPRRWSARDALIATLSCRFCFSYLGFLEYYSFLDPLPRVNNSRSVISWGHQFCFSPIVICQGCFLTGRKLKHMLTRTCA